jgi:hypothetical protein
MHKRNLKYAAGVSAAVSAALILVSCSGGNVDQAPSPTTSIKPAATLTVPGITSAVTYSFDLGAYDPTTNTYYVTDRTNKSIDVIDLTKLVIKGQFKPSGANAFTGCNSTTGTTTATPINLPGCNTITATPANFAVNNDASGPDGLDVVGQTLFVGDVNKLIVLNKTTGAAIAGSPVAIPSIPTGLRADEGCYDAANHLYAISTPGAANPFITFLDTTAADVAAPAVPTAPTVIVTVIMNGVQPAAPNASVGTQGLEACFSDGTNFWVNNDGSPANPDGEANAIPIADILAIKAGGGLPKTAVFQGSATSFLQNDGATPATNVPAGGVLGVTAGFGATAVKVYPLIAGCTPTGIAPGPGNELGTMCRPNPPARLDFVILDKTTGAIKYQMAGLGGGDQITYDAASKRWFLGNSRHTGNGISCGGGTAVTCPLSPALTVINDDGVNPPSLVAHVDNGNNSHSVAVGGGYVITPFSNPTASGGGATFPNGGINIWKTSQF